MVRKSSDMLRFGILAQENKTAIGVDGAVGAAAQRLVVKEDNQGLNFFFNVVSIISQSTASKIIVINKKDTDLPLPRPRMQRIFLSGIQLRFKSVHCQP